MAVCHYRRPRIKKTSAGKEVIMKKLLICKKRFLIWSVMLTLIVSTCFSISAFAGEEIPEGVASEDSEAVGCLSFVAKYEEGGSFASGHCFLMFTSYADDLTLEFTDLAGAYSFTEDFKEWTQDNENELSWRYTETYFYYLARDMGLAPELDYPQYESLSAEEKQAQYPDLTGALSARCDSANCFDTFMGEPGEDSRYQTMTYTHTLNRGDYITIGLYSDPETWQAFSDAVRYSASFADVEKAFEDGKKGDASFEEFLDLFESEFEQYAAGLVTYEEIWTNLAEFLSKSVENYENTIMPYLQDNSFIDGDTTGGLYVNRELHDQQASWDQSPNVIYTVDITQKQLDSLMAYENSGAANHYSLILHNCTVAAVEGWNAAVGYERDENGENTAEHSEYYLGAQEKNYNIMAGQIDTPHCAMYALTQMAENTGAELTAMDIVHGISLDDEEDESTPEPTSEPTAEPTSEPTAEPTAEPTVEPTAEPTAEPTVTPTPTASVTPTLSPTAVVTPTAASTGHVSLTDTPQSVKTGDENNVIGYILVILAATVVCILTVRRQIKKL